MSGLSGHSQRPTIVASSAWGGQCAGAFVERLVNLRAAALRGDGELSFCEASWRTSARQGFSSPAFLSCVLVACRQSTRLHTARIWRGQRDIADAPVLPEYEYLQSWFCYN